MLCLDSSYGYYANRFRGPKLETYLDCVYICIFPHRVLGYSNIDLLMEHAGGNISFCPGNPEAKHGVLDTVYNYL